MDTAQRRKQPRPPVSAKADQQVAGAYRVFETSVDGQAVLQDLCDSYYDVTSFVPGDPYATAFNEGRRSVVLAIFEILEDLREQKKSNRG